MFNQLGVTLRCFRGRWTLWLAWVVLLGFLPAGAQTMGPLRYVPNATGVTVVGGGVDAKGVLRIPASIPGVGPVTEIGDGAFNLPYELIELEIPDSVVRIGDEAFVDCGSLRRIQFGRGLRSIGNRAFMFIGTDYPTPPDFPLVLPEGLQEIGDEAFRHSVISSIQLPSTLLRIGAGAFAPCTARGEVVMPSGLIEVGAYAFLCPPDLIATFQGGPPGLRVIPRGHGPLSIRRSAFPTATCSSGSAAHGRWIRRELIPTRRRRMGSRCVSRMGPKRSRVW